VVAADTAYVLAYSTIMLNVDQHNPQVKKRMTKLEFIKNNRGINNNQDLPEKILSDIFDDIAANELRLKDDTDKPVDLAVITHGKNKKAAFLQQSQEILKRTQALFKERQKAHTQVTFYSASRVEHVKPMFESVWMSLLVTFSGPMQETEVWPSRRGRPLHCAGLRFINVLGCLCGWAVGPDAAVAVPGRLLAGVRDQQPLLPGAAEERLFLDAAQGYAPAGGRCQGVQRTHTHRMPAARIAGWPLHSYTEATST